MQSIFSLSTDDLNRLSSHNAVLVFRELLWAEATYLGISRNLIDVPGAINVADGGIDAEVHNAPPCQGHGLIGEGLTRYQIKTGDFAMNHSNIRDILFIEGTNDLKPRIKTCFEKEGKLIIVLFGWDNPEKKDNQIKEIFIEQLQPFSYSNPQVEIWRANNLISFFQLYPSLALKINGHGNLIFQSHQSWAQQDDMSKLFITGDAQSTVVSQIQELLRSDAGAVHIRVIGEPGIGKTKIVLEATRADDIQPLIIYCDSTKQIVNSLLFNELLRTDNNYSCILVVDECDMENSRYLWNKLKNLGVQKKLITIFNEPDDSTGTTHHIQLPLLGEKQICEIIQSYGVHELDSKRWAEICSGSPRVAHVIGCNLMSNPIDLLRQPDTANLWNRYIVGNDDPKSPSINQRRTVLRFLALFKKFGYEEPYLDESKAISELIQGVDATITWSRFQEIIYELRSRRILQGNRTLFISPKALHIKLWSDWWENYGHGFSVDNFISKLSSQLQGWFFSMFEYANESRVSAQVVDNLLGQNGPFDIVYMQTPAGSQLFLTLTSANPPAALNCLERTIGTLSKEQLEKFVSGRRQIIHALEKIVVWKGLFSRGAKLLLRLGEAENESWGNNASGVFAELFSLGMGKVAPTEATPLERFSILAEALKSDSDVQRRLGLRACNAALEINHFTRNTYPDYQGLRKEPELWMPKTWEEWFDAYRMIWNVLREKSEMYSGEQKQEATRILISRSRGLLLRPSLSDMVIETLSELSDRADVDKRLLISEIIRILHYDGEGLPPQTKEKIELIKASIIGDDYSSMMKRYVGMFLIEDLFDEQGKRTDDSDKIDMLVINSLKHPELLEGELPWLVTSENNREHLFGYELGKIDKEHALFPLICKYQLEVKAQANLSFLGGYLRATFENDRYFWESHLDYFASDKEFCIRVPELTWRSGMSDRAAQRIIDLIDKNLVDVSNLHFFTVGTEVRRISEVIFHKWIDALLRSNNPSANSVCLYLYWLYYSDETKKIEMPIDLTIEILRKPLTISSEDFKQGQHQMDDYIWAQIANVFISQHQSKSVELFHLAISEFGKGNHILDIYNSELDNVLRRVVKQNPIISWEAMALLLNPPLDSRGFEILRWLMGGFIDKEDNPPIFLIPHELIWPWVDKDRKVRSEVLATFAPKRFYDLDGKSAITRELLIRYGSDADVRKKLSSNFSTGFWSGPTSQHLQMKNAEYTKLREIESEKNVILWLDEYLSILKSDLEKSLMTEERDDY